MRCPWYLPDSSSAGCWPPSPDACTRHHVSRTARPSRRYAVAPPIPWMCPPVEEPHLRGSSPGDAVHLCCTGFADVAGSGASGIPVRGMSRSRMIFAAASVAWRQWLVPCFAGHCLTEIRLVSIGMGNRECGDIGEDRDGIPPARRVRPRKLLLALEGASKVRLTLILSRSSVGDKSYSDRLRMASRQYEDKP